MLVYSRTRAQFTEDIRTNCIEDIVLSAYNRGTGGSTSPSEINSWKSSLPMMNNVLELAKTPLDAGVSIEFRIPYSSKRIDFILTGQNDKRQDTVVIVELKQWTEAKRTEKDGIVSTYVGGGTREVEHPSYQAWTYSAMMEDFSETVRNDQIQLHPCAYLHNCHSGADLNHVFYSEYTDRAPAFLKDDASALAAFIGRYVRHGDPSGIMYRIENGKLSPSKNLADKLVSLLQGKKEFLMIDEQKLVYEAVLHTAKKALTDKHVLIVEGGPGTGKTVVAINLLVELTSRSKMVHYITKNSAPRAVYEAKLTASFSKSRISNMFKGSGSYIDVPADTFDVLLVDEAHRLNAKSGMFSHLGENQVKEIIGAARHSVFFIDEAQQVTFKDIGTKAEIEMWAKHHGATVESMKLSSQFRCNGSDAYLAWLDNILQIRETANTDLEGLNYTFEVVDSPKDLHATIERKNLAHNKARMVAGYCWNWTSKKNPGAHDIVLPEHNYSAQWNLSTDGMLWLLKPDSVKEVGCIHTCQGLELDWVGVIIGPDLIYRNGKLRTVPAARARMDKSLDGYKKLYKIAPELAIERADKIIRNTYRTLMTRGQKGCFIFCTDPETQRHFRHTLARMSTVESVTPTLTPAESPSPYPGLELEVVATAECTPFIDAVPLYNLKVSAGQLAESLNDADHDWVRLPDHIRANEHLFVAQVVGESMNKRIPNGSWCLFRKNLVGSRENKIVLAYHHSFVDEDHGGQYTIKRYHSTKVASDDAWTHTAITLSPETTAAGYTDIHITPDEADNFRIIAEFVAVL